jgi:cytochrome c peroxidase
MKRHSGRLSTIAIGMGLAGALLVGLAAALTAQPYPALGPLPPVPVPRDNPMTPEKIELGKLLYFDPRLSGDGSIACAKCHDPKKGWSHDGTLSPAYPQTEHWRHSMTILNTAYRKRLMWDGRDSSLEAQAHGPIPSPFEMNMNKDLLEERLRNIPEYRKRFQAVFGRDVRFEDLTKALAAFERTIVSKHAPFDRYMKGEKTAMSPEAIRGMALFQGKAGCIRCHHGPLFTDEGFHHLGVPQSAAEQRPMARATRHFFARVKGGLKEYQVEQDLGRYLITKKPEDKGKFLTMSLREIARTAPYMHNGAFKNLEEVIEFFNQGGGKDPNQSKLLKPLNLTAQEKADLKAFLEALSGEPVRVDPPELPAEG